MAKTSQEFYCGECQGYFILILNSYLDGYEVEIVCPNCKHEHRRCITKGQIVEAGRHSNAPKEKIYATKSSYHKEPIHARMANGRDWGAKRDGQVLKEAKDIAKEKKEDKKDERTPEQKMRDDAMRELWIERFAGRPQ
jgi:hypothetical protein